jgi:hypothetical protein
MQAVTTIGLDIAKSVFQVHGVDAQGNVAVRRQLKRRQVLPFFKKLSPCLVGIEACATSHHWSRELQTLGSRPDSRGTRDVDVLNSPGTANRSPRRSPCRRDHLCRSGPGRSRSSDFWTSDTCDRRSFRDLRASGRPIRPADRGGQLVFWHLLHSAHPSTGLGDARSCWSSAVLTLLHSVLARSTFCASCRTYLKSLLSPATTMVRRRSRFPAGHLGGRKCNDRAVYMGQSRRCHSRDHPVLWH